MIKLIIFVLFVVSNVQSNEVSEGLQEYLQEIFANLGPALRTGIPEAKVPVLDPYSPPGGDTTFEQNKGATRVSGFVRDVKIEGVSSISAENVKVDVIGLDVEAQITLRFEFIRATGQYKLDGKAFAIVPIRGQGGLFLETRGVTGNLRLSLKVDPGQEVLQANSAEISVDVNQIKANFENLINEKLSKVINEIINFLAKPVFNKVLKEKLDKKFSEELLKILNKKLKTVKYDKIQSLISG